MRVASNPGAKAGGGMVRAIPVGAFWPWRGSAAAVGTQGVGGGGHELDQIDEGLLLLGVGEAEGLAERGLLGVDAARIIGLDLVVVVERRERVFFAALVHLGEVVSVLVRLGVVRWIARLLLRLGEQQGKDAPLPFLPRGTHITPTTG